MLIEEFLCFVDLGGQVWTAAAIGVVEQHELSVVLADLVLGQGSLTKRIPSVGFIKDRNLWHIRKLQDEGSFATGHALVESSVYR